MGKPTSTTTTRSSSPNGPSSGPRVTGILSVLPKSWVPYAQLMRLDRPAGFYAFYFPYLIGVTYAACLSGQEIPLDQVFLPGLMFIGWCIILRGWTCTWNDNMDQEYDRAVERCRNRPIARGAVSTLQGHIFTVAQFLVGLLFVQSCLSASLDAVFDVLAMSALYILYPFGKRFTNYPQFILGFPFASGIVMACHVMGVQPFATRVATEATACLCISVILWTMTYDTIYAHQDLKDDLKAGVKSMAVRFKDTTKLLTTVLSLAQVALLVKVGLDLDLSLGYYIIGCGGTALSLIAMISLVDLNNPASCAWWFNADFWLVGGSISAGFFAHYMRLI
ncbi:UbiA prenyltransferase family-domain-containing protein [Xylariales sp. PMI_506]|nr:UbiA prenyltransferase family-domain-containing protein [Xylariales sp. PMI_506]